MRKVLIALAIVMARCGGGDVAFAQTCPAGYTRVTDTVYGPVAPATGQRTRFFGRVTIAANSSGVGANGEAFSKVPLELKIENGTLSVCLVPTDTATPLNITYRATFSYEGSQGAAPAVVETWAVPTSASPITLGVYPAGVRMLTTPPLLTGARGPAGPKGDKGDTGEQGPPGDGGATVPGTSGQVQTGNGANGFGTPLDVSTTGEANKIVRADGSGNVKASAAIISALDAVFNGVSAGKGPGTSTVNTIFGYQAGAGAAGLTGLPNTLTAFGYQAANGNGASMTSAHTTALGYKSFFSLSTGRGTAVGEYAGYSVTSALNNSFFGIGAGAFTRTGGQNTAMGFHTMFRNSLGANSTAMGSQTLVNLTTSVATFASLQGGSGYANGTYNSIELSYLSGSTTVAVENQGQHYPTVDITVSGGSVISVVIHGGTADNAGFGFVDTTTVMTTPNTNLGGTGSGFSVGVGSLITGDHNVAYGDGALNNEVCGSRNTAIGESAGFANLCGSYNVFVGNSAGAQEPGSYKLYVDSSNTVNPLIGGDFLARTLNFDGSGSFSASKMFYLANVTSDLQAQLGSKELALTFGAGLNRSANTITVPALGIINGMLAGSIAYSKLIGSDILLPYTQLTGLPSTFAPSAHAASHKNGGSDEIATATPGANLIPKAAAGGTLAAGWIPVLNQNTTGTAANVTGVVARANGGLNSATQGTGILRDGVTPAASELSGDAITNGSNAVTVKGINGTLLSGLATGLLKNTTSTGTPSIAAAGTDYAVATNGSSGQGLTSNGAGGFGSAVTFAPSATTDTTNAGNISSGTLPAARLPNPGASALGGIRSYAAVTNQWINAISTSGVPSSAQPAFSNLSGVATAAQIPAALSSTTSVNGSAIPAGVTLTQTIASGTAAMGTSAISSGACATVVTATATGTATTDNIMADFNADPTAVTGYVAGTSGMLTIIKYPTSNTVNFKVCNNTAASITPGAITLNWRVVR